MVDPDVAIDGLVGRGELLTLTTPRRSRGVTPTGSPTTSRGARRGRSRRGAGVETTSLAERAVRFVTDPVAASLLIVLAVLLIVGDFFVEGFGLAGRPGSACSRSSSGATSWPG
jgi:hypothetical protein